MRIVPLLDSGCVAAHPAALPIFFRNLPGSFLACSWYASVLPLPFVFIADANLDSWMLSLMSCRMPGVMLCTSRRPIPTMVVVPLAVRSMRRMHRGSELPSTIGNSKYCLHTARPLLLRSEVSESRLDISEYDPTDRLQNRSWVLPGISSASSRITLTKPVNPSRCSSVSAVNTGGLTNASRDFGPVSSSILGRFNHSNRARSLIAAASHSASLSSFRGILFFFGSTDSPGTVTVISSRSQLSRKGT
mmetsp:Transcript_17638/g.33715  ORF Transcript_17638/g.33715 Transcript_17638/m.33715 type:complete len:247 (-) Transcript_17638:1259-1999(-)